MQEINLVEKVPKNRKYTVPILIIVVLVIISLISFLLINNNSSKVKSYQDCLLVQGSNVMELEPRYCTTPDGELFLEDMEFQKYLEDIK